LRRDGVLVERVLDELIIYDQDRDLIHCLNPSAARIWDLCDGHRTPAAIAEALSAGAEQPIEERVVWFGLGRLSHAGLLTEKVPLPEDIRAQSRRGVLRRLAAAGAKAVLLPVIVSIVAPTPVEAGNTKTKDCMGQPCASDADCKPPCSSCVTVMIGGSIKACI
jgi:hypothetical protein